MQRCNPFLLPKNENKSKQEQHTVQPLPRPKTSVDDQIVHLSNIRFDLKTYDKV